MGGSTGSLGALPFLARFLSLGGVSGSDEGELSGDKSRLALPPPPTAASCLRLLPDLKEREGPGSDNTDMDEGTSTL